MASANAPNSVRQRARTDTGGHREQACGTEASMEAIAFQGCHVAPEQVYGPTIVAQAMVGLAEIEIALHLEGKIPQGLGAGQGSLRRRDRLVIIAHQGVMEGDKGGDLSEPTSIVQGLGQRLGLAQAVEHPVMLSEPR